MKRGKSILFDDFDKAENFMRYFSLIYESDDRNEFIYACNFLPVLDENAFDVAMFLFFLSFITDIH